MGEIMRIFIATAVAILLCLSWRAAAASAETPSDTIGRAAQVELKVPDAARAGPNFDVDRATQAYMDLLTPEQKARSDAYFEGGYWLQLWDFLYGIGIAALLLFGGLSAWLRDRTRLTRWPALNAGFYGIGYTLLVALLSFPLTLYGGFFREHAYGLSTQGFSGWFGDWATARLVSVVMAFVAVWILYAVFRRAPRRWWIWGTGIGVVFLVVMLALGPVFIAPLFNDYKPLPQGPIRSQILSLARANGIPADNVYWFDASKQSTRISANVSGFGPTTRISLNDNLLMRSPRESIEAVMGHEMGHYVLHHSNKMILEFGLVLFAGFAFVAWGFRRLVGRWGDRWRVRGIDDPAGLPLIAALFSVFLFILTPITNGIVRTSEIEADYFGLNAARQPDGFAFAAMQLADYRKIQPGYWEELIFFDHPSGYHRVHAAMKWKAEHLGASGTPAQELASQGQLQLRPTRR